MNLYFVFRVFCLASCKVFSWELITFRQKYTAWDKDDSQSSVSGPLVATDLRRMDQVQVGISVRFTKSENKVGALFRPTRLSLHSQFNPDHTKKLCSIREIIYLY